MDLSIPTVFVIISLISIILVSVSLDRQRLKRVNQLSGLIIIAFGVLSLWALAVG